MPVLSTLSSSSSSTPISNNVTAFISLNLHKSTQPTSELVQYMKQFNKTIACIQEPHTYSRGLTGFSRFKSIHIGDHPRAAIVYSPSTPILPCESLSNEDVAVGLWTRTPHSVPVVVLSVYCDINHDFDFLLPALKFAQNNSYNILQCGDINAHSTLWGCESNNRRGTDFEEFIATFHLECLNLGSSTTFHRGTQNTIVDVVMASFPVTSDLKSWEVSRAFSSDHSALLFSISSPPLLPIRQIKKCDWKLFERLLDEIIYNHPDLWNEATIQSEVALLQRHILLAFNQACPLVMPCPHKAANPWWTDKLTVMKEEYHKLLLENQENPTANSQLLCDISNLEYKRAMKVAKKDSWQHFLSQANSAQEMAVITKCLEKKMSHTIGLLTAAGDTVSIQETLTLLADTHFPGHVITTEESSTHSKRSKNKIPHAQLLNNHKYVTNDLIKSIYSNFGAMKAAGPDGIRPIVLQHLPDKMLDRITAIYKASLLIGHTARQWRENTIIFLPKTGKADYSLPKSYRPITLAPFLLKGLEKCALWRLESTVLKKGSFSRHQHAFLPDKSCDTALSEAHDYLERSTQRGHLALAVSLDIRGAFDNVNIDRAIDCLRRKGIPFWFISWYEHYLRNRFSTISLHSSSITFRHTLGTPQGGVLSPIIWILVFDDLLNSINDCPAVRIIGYADDGLIIVTGTDIAVMQQICQSALDKALIWGTAASLAFCPDKTSYIIFSTQEYTGPKPVLRLGDKTISESDKIKYLGIWFDSALNFEYHISDKINKAKTLLTRLNSIVSSRYGPIPHLLKWAYQAIALPRLMYGCHIWSREAQKYSNKLLLRKINRLACLAITAAFPHSPTNALQILCDLPPLHLALLERGYTIYQRVHRCHPVLWDGKGKGKKVSHEVWWQKVIGRHLPDWTKKIPCTNTSRVLLQKYTVSLSRDDPPPEPGDIDVFTDGSKGDGEGENVGCGVQIYSQGQALHHGCFRLPSYCSVYQAELEAICLAAQYLQSLSIHDRTIRIFSDSLSSLDTLTHSRLRTTLEYDTKSRLNLLGLTNSISLHWVKAHVGTEGNEKADQLAKAGSHLPQISHELPPPVKSLKLPLTALIYDKWEKEWHKCKDCRQFKLWFSSVRHNRIPKILSLTRPKLSLLCQWFTGFNNLGYHTKNKNEIYNAACRLCKSHTAETVWHLATSCPVLDAIRQRIFGGSGPENGCWSISQVIDFYTSDTILHLLTTRHDGIQTPPTTPHSA
jgi:ribonuclease HI